MTENTDRYTHGHHESVLRSHTWRTADNSAAYLLGNLRHGDALLDVGCGPGTISADFARLVSPGPVTAIDLSPEVIDQARESHAGLAFANLRFEVGDVYNLAYVDETFDVVHSHQMLQHLSRPVGALVEMRRVLRREGLLAVRDADFGAFAWYPDDKRLDRWMAIYQEMTQRNHAQANAGRHLVAWVRAAGFRDVRASSSNWIFHTPGERRWWGQLWADRVRESAFASHALEYGLSSASELADIAEAFEQWSRDDDGVFIAVHGEVLARR